jgi:hypothetical protein
MNGRQLTISKLMTIKCVQFRYIIQITICHDANRVIIDVADVLQFLCDIQYEIVVEVVLCELTKPIVGDSKYLRIFRLLKMDG